MVSFRGQYARNHGGKPYIVIVENGVKLRLNIVDTPGYGDQVNNENWYVTAATATIFI
jgi:hypothetical protein